MEVQQNKMEFFQKLGYRKEEVCRVLDKLGQEASENDLLQELIQMGRKPQEPNTRVPGLHTSPAAQAPCQALPFPEQLAEGARDPASNLRPIVIDGSNVAMSHGNKEVFSCLGIQLVVDWFKCRGHQYIKVFVPSWRKEPSRFDTPITDQHVLEKLEKQAILVYTPSRKMKGKRLVCYDDRYIVKLAYEQDGVIVSNDNFRDLQNENPEWKWFIEQRLLMYSFVNDKFMPPDDPLGRHGPSLDSFLSKKTLVPEPKWQLCPYGKKCTYGIKCKFYHPERLMWDQLSVADELRVKSKSFSPICRTEEEKMKTGMIKNRSWNTSTLAGRRGGCGVGSQSSSTYNLAELHTNSSRWEEDNSDSGGSWMTMPQSHPQTVLQDQAKHLEAVSKQISALSLRGRTYSGNCPSGPGKYEDLVDEQYRDCYPYCNQSLPVSHHSLCLDCPCLEVCSFEGCYRQQVSAAQTLPTPSYLGWEDLMAQQSGQYCSVVSSAESVSYCKQGDVQYPENLQAKSFDPPHLLDSSSFRTVDYYNHESQQGSTIRPISGEQRLPQQTMCFGLAFSRADQAVSSYADSVDTGNSTPLVQRSGNLHNRSPSREPW